jgi:hypothetical protein
MIIGPNHFQSTGLKDTESNVENMLESSSVYRFNKTKELIDRYSKVDHDKAALILRDRQGKNGEDIGMGNEKSICQLIAHHSIIFKPHELKFWISTQPYQLGEYVCYDLNKVFNEFPGMNIDKEIREIDGSIPADSFLYSTEYQNYKRFKYQKSILKPMIDNLYFELDDKHISTFTESNPNYFYVYQLAGDYYFERNAFDKAKYNYEIALTKEITNLSEKEHIENKLKIIAEQ